MLIGKIISHYEILEKIGEGGMGEIYKAQDLRLKRNVAIKFLPQQFSLEESAHQRFINEAQTASALNHPNICSIYDVDKTDGMEFIVMEFIEGESLREVLNREKLLPVNRVLDIALILCNTLKLTHDKGIIHGDIKPDNIMFTADGNLKIMDFGLAKLRDQVKEASAETSLAAFTDEKLDFYKTLSTLHGTVSYMAPELIKKELYDDKVDMFSLGVMIYESLTGKLPFIGKDYIEVLQSIIIDEPEPPSKLNPEISPELERIILRTMEKDRQNRCANMEEFCKDIEKVKSKSEKFKRIRKLALQAFGLTALFIVLAFALIQGGHYVINHFDLDPRWNQIILIWMMLGLLISGIAIFYHGKQKPKRILQSEIILYSIILIIGCLSSIWFWKSTPETKTYFPNPASSIAVMNFEVDTNDEEINWLSKGLQHMLITNLKQFPNLQVMSYDRIYELLDELGKDGTKVISKETAIEIAQKTGVANILLGKVFKWNNLIRIDFQLHNLSDESLSFADKVIETNPFKLADKLASQIRIKLDESSIPGDTVDIMKITTSSPEAYRYFLRGEGEEYANQNSVNYFAKAVSLDSTFALAYLGLALEGKETGLLQMKEVDSLFAKAVQYSDKVTDLERLIILSNDAHWHGHLRKYRIFNEQLIKKYPNDLGTYTLLAPFHMERREYDIAIKYWKEGMRVQYWPSCGGIITAFNAIGKMDSVKYYVNKMVEWIPNSPVSAQYEILKVLLPTENYPEALRASKLMRSLYPEIPFVRRCVGIVFFYTEQLDSAEAEFLQMGKLGWPSETLEQVSSIDIYQGRYKKTKKILTEKRRSVDLSVKDRAYKLTIFLYELLGDEEKSAKILNSYKGEIYERYLSSKKHGDTFIADSLLIFEIPIYYYNGKVDKALKICDQVENEIIQNDLGGGYEYKLTQKRADILYGSNRLFEASTIYKELISENFRKKAIWYFRLADCYFNQGMYQEAREVLLQVNIVNEPDLLRPGIDFGYSFPRTFYLLGKVNEKLGNWEEAINAYEHLLEIWKKADEDIPELIEARQRIMELKGKT